MTQEKIADSSIEMQQFRLLVLHTAWMIDRHRDYKKVRKDVAAVKVARSRVLHDVVQRFMYLHGAIGISSEMPFSKMMVAAEVMACADGPTEVPNFTEARQILRGYQPADGLWPSEHLPTRRAAARARFAQLLELEIAEN